MKKHQKILISALSILTAAAGTIALINRCISRAAALSDKESTGSLTFSWRFGDISYTKKGSGSPLLLVHDLSAGSSSYEWSRVVDALSGNHTVYCVDLPGCGNSERQKITFTNFYFVQFLTEFIKNVIGQPTDIAATGLSASFVLTACNYNRAYFKRLILINPVSLTKLNRIPSARTKLNKSLLEQPLIGTLVYHMLSSKKNIRDAFTKYLFNDPRRIPKDAVDSYYLNSHRFGSKGKYLQASIAGRFVNLNITHALRSIDNTIVIIGGETKKDITATIQQYVSVNAAVESVVIPNTMHLPQLEAPVDFVRQLRVYLYE